MRPFHRFILRLVIFLSLAVAGLALLQRPDTTSKPTEKTAAISNLESENA